MDDFVMAKLKHNTKTQIFFFKINLNQCYMKEKKKSTKIKQRQRKSTYNFLWENRNDIKFIQNKIGRRKCWH